MVYVFALIDDKVALEIRGYLYEKLIPYRSVKRIARYADMEVIGVDACDEYEAYTALTRFYDGYRIVVTGDHEHEPDGATEAERVDHEGPLAGRD